MRVQLVASMVALLLSACTSPPDSNSGVLVGGDRLAVEVWRAGRLELPWRFVDRELDAPCVVRPVFDPADPAVVRDRCVPADLPPVPIGWADAGCSTLAAADDGTLADGDLVTGTSDGSGGLSPGVFRIGAALPAGPLSWIAGACMAGAVIHNGAIRAVERVEDGTLVGFDPLDEPHDGLLLRLLQGEDGSSVVAGTARGDGAPCVVTDQGCLDLTAVVQVEDVQLGWSDPACTQPLVFAGNEGEMCPGEGTIVVGATLWAAEGHVLGRLGAPFDGPVFRATADGGCDREGLLGADVRSTLTTSLHGCLRVLDPAPSLDAGAATTDVVRGSPLAMAFHSVGGRVVEATLTLPDGAPCTAARTSDGVRCVPTPVLRPAWSSYGPPAPLLASDYCATGEGGPTLYAFAGRPPVEGIAELEPSSHGVPGLRSFARLVPWRGPVFLTWWTNEEPTCRSINAASGYYVAQQGAPADLPQLTSVTR